ncbi:protein Spt2p [Monosporozyma unispora]|nr:hypothetical protein C6P44_001878 [Kazachstania unispora]
MSFLSKLSELKKSAPVRSAPLLPNKSNNNTDNIESLLPKQYVRDEDPAVKRLKELRRKEQIKNGELLKKKNATSTTRRANSTSTRKRKAKDEDGGGVGTVYKKRIGSSTTHRKPSQTNTIQRREPIKKMTFEELMRQAEQNDKPGMVTKANSEPPRQSAPTKLHKPGFKSKTPGSKPMVPNGRGDVDPRRVKSPTPTAHPRHQHNSQSREPEEKPLRISLPTNKFAQPNARIKQRLEKKGYRPDRRHHDSRDRYAEEDEVDSELDDFIEDDEEEMDDRYRSSRNEDAGYDRDEIWAMFNKGRNRSHYRDDYYDDYNDEDDAMEANEMEIMDEEEYATKMARLEDKKEEAWLKKHEAEKKMKKRR